MDRSIYTAMSGAKALMQRQETLTNNLANVSTNGFRADLAAFRAVPVPAGTHEVVFSYRNPEVVRTWMLGGICLLLTALLGGLAVWRKW